MFTQIIVITNDLSRGVYERTTNALVQTATHIKQFIKINSRKLGAASMAFKLVSVMFLLAIMPVNVKYNHPKYQTDIKFATDQAMPLAVKNRQVAVNSSASNYDAERRIAAGSQNRQIAYASYEPIEGVENFIGLYKDAAGRYGIPWQVLAAVHYVETGASGSTNEGSYAGAIGPMQFMPGTWRAYAVDGNGDGNADITNVNDAVYGAANLLAAGGAAEGNVDAALFNYNHAQWYVDRVNEVAGSIQ